MYDRTTLSDEDVRSGRTDEPINTSVIEDEDVMLVSFIVLRRRNIANRPYTIFLAINAIRIFIGSDIV